MPAAKEAPVLAPTQLRLQPAYSIDCSSLVPAPSASLIRGLAPSCVVFHPERPLLAVGVSGYVAVYDILSGSRLGRLDLKSIPVEMCFAPDGSVLVVAVQDWVVFSISLSSWKSRVLVPKRTKMDKPLESCLLAVAPGYTPFVYFCRYGKDVLRLAHVARPAGARDKKEPGASSWGLKVKLEAQKPIIGLACHYLDQQLMVLNADGVLRGYAITGSMGEVLSPLWAIQVQDVVDKGLPAEGTLSVVPHPSVQGGALILQASRLGTVCVLEAAGRSPPNVVMRQKMPGWAATLGVGLHKDTSQILVFGLTDAGKVRAGAYRMGIRSLSTGITLSPTKVDPPDLGPLLDPLRRLPRPPPPPPVLNQGASVAGAPALPSRFSVGGIVGGMQLLYGQQGGAGEHSQGGAAAAAAVSSAACQALWNPSISWANEATCTMLLEPQLAPLVLRVLVHPTLGCVACQLEPSFFMQANTSLGLQPSSMCSYDELCLARRTASVPLLRLVSQEPHHQAYRGALTCAQITPLSAWSGAMQPPALPSTPSKADADGTDTANATGTDAAAAAAAVTPSESGKALSRQSVASSAAATTGAGAGAPASTAFAAAPSIPGALQVPPHAYYISPTSGQLMKYSLVTRLSSPLAVLPSEGFNGGVRVARQVQHSAKSGAWLVFFEDIPAPGAQQDAAAERWHWTLITGASMAKSVWLKMGKHGCFIGPDDSHVAIIEGSGRLAAVFEVATTNNANAAPLFTLSLEAASLANGIATPLYPGPPLTQAPVPESEPAKDVRIADSRRMRSTGAVMWQTADGLLAMATLPSLQAMPMDAGDSSSDDEDAPANTGGGSLPQGHHFGTISRQAALSLLPGEQVLQASWQAMAEGAAAAAVTAGLNPTKRGARVTPAAAAAAAMSCACAILTTHRLLLVTGNLKIIAAIDIATSPGCGAAVGNAVSSVAWAGPMLLYTTLAGRVMQLTWTGSVHVMATLSGAAGHLSILGVTADGLLLLRTPFSNSTASSSAPGSSGAGSNVGEEVVVRPVALLQPLALAWASLAAAGLLLHGGGSQVRSALQGVMSKWDAASVTPKGLWALMAAGAWDVAAAIANHAVVPVDPGAKLAANAAAGRWSEVCAAVLAEHQRSLYHPGPPPPGTEIHCKLLAAASGAIMHGQVAKAQELLQAAGEWRAAMVLAVCQGNASAVYSVSKAVADAAQSGAGVGGVVSQAEAQEAGALAAALRSLYGGVGSQAGDVKLQLVGPEPGAGGVSTASGWPLAATGSPAPATEAVAGTTPKEVLADTELGAVPQASRDNVVQYYGLWPAATAALSAAAASSARQTPSLVAPSGPSGSTRQQGASSIGGGEPNIETISVSSSVDAAQAAARAEFFGFGGLDSTVGGGGGGGAFGGGPGIVFTDSDDDETADGRTASIASGMSGALAGGGGPSKRFQVRIRGRDEVASGGTGAGAPGDSAALREAAKQLKMLGPPGANPAAAGPTGGGAGGQLQGTSSVLLPGGGAGSVPAPAAAPGGANKLGLPGADGVSPALLPPRAAVGGGAAAPAAAASAAVAGTTSSGLSPAGSLAQFPPGMSSVQLYQQGVSLMESGDWRNAAAHFSRAMSVLTNDEPQAASSAQRKAFCAQYYACVRMMEVATAGGHGAREAQLYRYLAALGLDDRHRSVLLREAITRNKVQRNYRYAAEQLTSLITMMVATAPTEYMAALQADLDECDRAGGANADIPKDEDLEDFVACVAAANSKEDVDLLVVPLLSS